MLAIRAKYDGQNIHLPQDAKHLPPGNVIILFEDDESGNGADWLKLQEQALANAWDDEEDGVYDEA